MDWIISSKTYTKNVIEKFKQLIGDGSPKYSLGEYKIPMDKDYHPELDDSPLNNAELQNRYQSMVGSLNWAITLGWFDIQFLVTTMARYSHAPWEGHLKAVIRIFEYLEKFHKAKIVIDPTLPDHQQFPYDDLSTWRDLYPDAQEELTSEAPKPREVA